MATLALCCLLLMGPLGLALTLPVTHLGMASRQSPAPQEEIQGAVEELEHALLPQMLLQALQTPEPIGPRKPRGSQLVDKALPGQDPSAILSLLVARGSKEQQQQQQHVVAAKCFWKYCV